jgi:SAM-dependent methyltransferase
MPDLHDAAARGFEAAGEAYERGRPDYPEAAISYLASSLALTPSDLVVELGAGTGKFTRGLLAAGLRVLALEPVSGMRRQLRRGLPAVPLAAAVAEALPVRDGAAAAVFAAQAFHWFRPEAALSEAARVLRPGGGLGLIWNVRDEGEGWVSRLSELLAPHRGDVPGYKEGAWRRALAAAPFRPLPERSFPYQQELTPEGLVDRVASISFIAALPDAARAGVLAEVRRLAMSHPDTMGGGLVSLPYRTEVFLYARV